jgi:hypothetical protein
MSAAAISRACSARNSVSEILPSPSVSSRLNVYETLAPLPLFIAPSADLPADCACAGP